MGWAAPPPGSDPAFANVAIGMGRSVHYRFKARKAEGYTVVFGLCEGYWAKGAQRILVLEVEGKPVRTVDMATEFGRNQPALLSFPARDENRDGWIDVSVAAATNSPDKNTILNVLWVLSGDAKPDQQSLAGTSTCPALAHLDCGADAVENHPPRHDSCSCTCATRAPRDRCVPRLTVESDRRLRRMSSVTACRLAAGPCCSARRPLWAWSEAAAVCAALP